MDKNSDIENMLEQAFVSDEGTAVFEGLSFEIGAQNTLEFAIDCLCTMFEEIAQEDLDVSVVSVNAEKMQKLCHMVLDFAELYDGYNVEGLAKFVEIERDMPNHERNTTVH